METPPNAVELNHVKTVVFKDLPDYLADHTLMAWDKHTGEMEIMRVIRAWKRAYPDVNPYLEIPKAYVYEITNGKRKTRNHATAFLNTWMKNSFSMFATA